MQRQIRILALFMVLLFAVLFAQLNYIQVFAASKLAGNQANPRLITEQFEVKRGDILASDERTVLATSRATPGRLKYLRVYPSGPLYAHVTGYESLVYGPSRLESTYDDYLSARATELSLTNLKDLIQGQPKRGASIVTTIDPRIQQAAAGALGHQHGAVVALDPRNGQILAMYSTPSYEPTLLSSHDPDSIRRAWKQLVADDAQPLLSNATDQLYAPGSSFKLVDTAAALENGLTPQTRFPNPAALKLPQTTHLLHNFGGEHCAGGASTITLEQALVESCNVTFGELGLKLGPEKLYTQAKAFGFDRHVPFDLPFAEGVFPPPSAFADRLPAVAFSAIGQSDVAANPLQMALVTSAVAGRGVEMAPQLVREIRDPTGVVIRSFHPRVLANPISPLTAAQMTRMMVGVVQEGTGTSAQIPGVPVAGKTGTAETSGGAPNAWFTCFAPADNPQIVVSVVVLHGGNLGSEATGGQVSAPIARAVIEAALGRNG
jgi:peptidoglycan glycosyltransferase